MRVKHLSLFLHTAKSCPYLDGSRATFGCEFSPGRLQQLSAACNARAPLYLQVLPILCTWKLGLSSSLPILRGQFSQELPGWNACPEQGQVRCVLPVWNSAVSMGSSCHCILPEHPLGSEAFCHSCLIEVPPCQISSAPTEHQLFCLSR